MPETGIVQVAHDDILGYEEMHRLVALLCGLGVRRVRITGGEPLLRRGVVDFLSRLGRIPSGPELLLTTNGLLLKDKLGALRNAGVRRINLSLDSLDRATYQRITRRDGLAEVLPLLDDVPAADMTLKVNMVALSGINDHEIPRFADLARQRNLQVRFIEPMPFDGGGPWTPFEGDRILERLADLPGFDEAVSTSEGVAECYRIEGWLGSFGIIRGHSRTFCSTCSRLRISADGGLRTCLYGDPVVDLRRLLRSGAPDQDVAEAIILAVSHRFIDGHEAEQEHQAGGHHSMASIGG